MAVDYDSNPGATVYYGDTEAVVLDAYRTADGQLRHYEDLGLHRHTYQDRPCMIWVRERQRRLMTLTCMLENNDYTAQHPAGCQIASRALHKYVGYNKLFGERKYARKNPFVKISGSFMDLPGEIRNRIYRLHLLVGNPIELLPKSAHATHKAANSADLRSDHKFLVIRRSRLPLLRSSKDVNKEASEIFYGENEFRFTGQNGWNWLHGYLRTIGKRNTQRLRIVTIHVPWRAAIDITDMARRRDIPKQFQDPPRPRTHALFRHVGSGVLKRLTGLEELNIVLPMWLDVLEIEDLTRNVAKSAVGLRVKLIHLARCVTDEQVNYSQRPLSETELQDGMDWDRHGQANVVDPEIYAEAMGWGYEKAVLDEDGGYST